MKVCWYLDCCNFTIDGVKVVSFLWQRRWKQDVSKHYLLLVLRFLWFSWRWCRFCQFKVTFLSPGSSTFFLDQKCNVYFTDIVYGIFVKKLVSCESGTSKQTHIHVYNYISKDQSYIVLLINKLNIANCMMKKKIMASMYL